jgi:proteasome lid subunit RPN8/RPN11
MLANGVRHEQDARGLAAVARRAWGLLQECLFPRPIVRPLPQNDSSPRPGFQAILRLRLTEGVAETLWQEYEEHRDSPSGDEETGWVLLGYRERDEAMAVATLPAGTHRDAGVAHVRFDTRGQDIASRIVRQDDRRLTFLGIVHTHPGSLRQPSRGDFEGDIQLVAELRGGAGVFGIGTASERLTNSPGKPNVQERGRLMFSWYSLAVGQSSYQPLPVELMAGPDRARPLHDVWGILETHAERLTRLLVQQAGVKCKVIEQDAEPVLAVTVPLAEGGDSVTVLLNRTAPRYLVAREGNLFAVDPEARSIDQGVYLLLAELAARA